MSKKIETQDQKKAFKEYFHLGPQNRSYAKVALLMKKALSTIEKWGREFKWAQRVDELDREAVEKYKERAIVEKEVDYKQRNLKILKRYLLECAKAISEGRMAVTAKNMIDAMREEERIRTGISGNIEVTHKIELKGLTNEQIQNKLATVVSRFDKFKEIKNFDELEDPIETVEYKEVKNDG